MEEALTREVENLRAENKILRDSLVEVRKEKPACKTARFSAPAPSSASASDAAQCPAGRRVIAILCFVPSWLKTMLTPAAAKVKERLAPGAAKLTAKLGRKIAANPAPLLAVVLCAGFLLGRLLDRR
jgi:hypothetical protein